MPKLNLKAVILAAIEAGYGVDAAPTAAANAILCEPPKLSVLSKKLTRNNTRAYLGQLAPVNIGQGLKLEFKTEFKGSGVVATVPEIGVLFRACGYTETIVPATSVDYDPNSDVFNGESVTIYYYLDGMLHKVAGCRGTFKLAAKVGGYPAVTWTFTGIYAGPVDQALVTGTYNQTVPPNFVSAAFQLDGYAGVVESLNIDGGNTVTPRASANAATGILEYYISARAVAGDCDPEAPGLATKNFWDMWSNSNRVALTCDIGQTAGNKCVITAPKVALGDIQYGDRNGMATLALPLVFTPNAGNDEIKFSFQ